MKTVNSTWLQCTLPRPECQNRLICFPHAGGSASFFRSWAAQMIDCEIYAVRYPGRAERIDEALPKNLQQLAFEIAKAIEPLAEHPIALFGHSMGAPIALETARRLEACNVNVAHLFASGSRHGPLPPPPESSEDIVEEDDDAVCAQLVTLGGTDPNIAADPIFRELVLPSVRSDGKMFHAYRMELEPQLRCPVTTIFGDNDVHTDTRPWRDLAPKGFREYCVPGDHFYLTSMPPFSILQERINTVDSAKKRSPTQPNMEQPKNA